MSHEKKLLSVFEELREALLECDETKLDSLISDDYQGFSLNGTIDNKELVLQTFRPGGIEISRYAVEDIACEASNTFGFIAGRGIIEGRYGDNEFKHEVLFTDIFKFINRSWRYYRSQVTEIRSA